MKSKPNKPKVVIIACPATNVTREPTHLLKFLEVIKPLSDEVFIITGKLPEKFRDKAQLIRVRGHLEEDPLLIKAASYLILTQAEIGLQLSRISRSIDTVIFFTGMLQFWLPVLVAKTLRKRIILIATGSASRNARAAYQGKPVRSFILPRLYRLIEKLNFAFADQIVVESEGVITYFGLEKYQEKIYPKGALPVDTTLFRVKKEYGERKNMVGYLGRLVPGKGLMNLARALPLILQEKAETRFIIGGGGELYNKIEQELSRNGLSDKVTLTGWVPGEKFVDYLNELKLFVFPSYAEGLPYAPMEAMACGTPVLATPVGGIPDIIKDGETGFILADNSPEGIAKSIIRALEHPRLDEIIQKARRLVEERYTYSAAVERYRSILH